MQLGGFCHRHKLGKAILALTAKSLVLVGLPWGFVTGAATVVASAEIGTHWIWTAGTPHPDDVRVFAKSFEMDEVPRHAWLRTSADFCDVVVTLNGHRVLACGPYDSLPAVDIGAQLRDGTNRISVHATATGGPAAVAVHVEIPTAVGEPRFVSSDITWSAPAALVARGRVDVETWWRRASQPSIHAFDEYNQWEEAHVEGAAPRHFELPPDFAIELLYETADDEGSWISLALDDEEHFLVGTEKRGVLRFTPPKGSQPAKIESIDERWRGVHGLCRHGDTLYANASDSKRLVQLRDPNGNGEWDDVRELRVLPGGTGDHGRNGITGGPDGRFYAVHGDSVQITPPFESLVPYTRELRDAAQPLAGHVVRFGHDAGDWQIFAAGLRNPFRLAFNRQGDVFTFDADSESSSGLDWYRPTRILHLISGADFGWRGNSLETWRGHFPDSLPATVTVGRSSPTALIFPYATNFPPAYRQALFAGDWAFGRLFAVHLVPRGASYSGHVETFLRGRPFNIVDIAANRGALYLLTGGYGTRSALYRLSYRGPSKVRDKTRQEVARQAYANQMRKLRRRLERLHQPDAHDAIETAWSYLAHADPWIRHAARTALEHQDIARWRARVFAAGDAEQALAGLLALARQGHREDRDAIHAKLFALPIEQLRPVWQLTAVRVKSLVDQWSAAHEATSEKVVRHFGPLFPSGDDALDHELSGLLVDHGSPVVVEQILQLLGNPHSQEITLHYLRVLSRATAGWNPPARMAYFRLLEGASFFQGDEGFRDRVAALQRHALAMVPADERTALAALIERGEPSQDDAPAARRSLVRKWTVRELMQSVGASSRPPDPTRGAQIYRAAQCAKCHRLGAVGRALGPDLSGLAARFSRRQIIESIVAPSAVVSSRYRNYVVYTDDGETVRGQVVWNGFRKSLVRIAPDPERPAEYIEIAKQNIASFQESPTSPMPAGLLDTFTAEEVRELVKYLESGGARAVTQGAALEAAPIGVQ